MLGTYTTKKRSKRNVTAIIEAMESEHGTMKLFFADVQHYHQVWPNVCVPLLAR